MYYGYLLKTTEADARAACEFATASIESRREIVASRGQTNIDKLRRDITFGAIAECAVWRWLVGNKIDCNPPDFTVYHPSEKSFDADLTCEYGQLHVKTFSNPRWSSWVFQYSGHGQDTDKLLVTPHPGHYLVLTELVRDMNVVLRFLVRQPDVLGLFEPPILPHLQLTKRVLYQHTLLKQDWVPDTFQLQVASCDL